MRRELLVLSALVAATAIAVGSVGFSSAGSDRGVSVTTVDDGNAYLSLHFSNDTLSPNKNEEVTVTFVTVENQFTEQIDITVDYKVENPDDEVVTPDGSKSRIEKTETNVDTDRPFEAKFTCNSDGDYTITFDVTAQSDSGSVSVETTDSRTVTYDVTCESTDNTGTG